MKTFMKGLSFLAMILLGIYFVMSLMLQSTTTNMDSSTNNRVNSRNHITKSVDVGDGCGRVFAVELDGHEYIVYDGFHEGSIIHSPNCNCLKTY